MLIPDCEATRRFEYLEMIGCIQIRLRRIKIATFRALTCFCLPPPVEVLSQSSNLHTSVYRHSGLDPESISFSTRYIAGCRIKSGINPDIAFVEADMHVQEKAGAALPQIVAALKSG